MRRGAAVLAAIMVALVVAGCAEQSPRAAGQLSVTGVAQVTANDGTVKPVTGSRKLSLGEQVRVVSGSATLGLGEGGQMELRTGSAVKLAGMAKSGADDLRAELVAGDALVTGSPGRAEVMAGDALVRVTGAARVTRALSVVVATYRGSAEVESVAKGQSVPALRQVTVPAPGLASRLTPLFFSASDSWDQRYLGDAVDLGNQLVARSRGFTAQLAPGQDSAEPFLRQVLPGLEAQPFEASMVEPSLPAAETMVGAAITLEGTRGDFRERWQKVFGFHAEGAPWGIVALDQGVDRQALLAAVDAATRRLPSIGTQATVPAPVTSPASPVSVPTPVPTTASPSAAPAPVPASPPSTVVARNVPAPGPAAPVTEPAGGGTVNLGVPLVDDTVNATVDLLTGLLKSVGTP